MTLIGQILRGCDVTSYHSNDRKSWISLVRFGKIKGLRTHTALHALASLLDRCLERHRPGWSQDGDLNELWGKGELFNSVSPQPHHGTGQPVQPDAIADDELLCLNRSMQQWSNKLPCTLVESLVHPVSTLSVGDGFAHPSNLHPWSYARQSLLLW